MNKTKALSFVLLLLASTGFIFGTFSFSSASAERGVSAEVVADDRALVNYQSSSQTVEDGGTVELVTVGNGLSHPIDVRNVSINDGSFTISDPTQPANIHSSSSVEILRK
jgi:hypothetical protein